MKQSTITNYFNKEPRSNKQLNTCLKNEVNIDWDQADNCHGKTLNNIQKQYSARVYLERLPESLVQKYINNKNVAPVETHPAEFSTRKKCQRCQKNFKHENSLRTHMAYCGKERNIQCTYCSYKTKYKVNLTVHVSKIHRNGKIRKNKHDDDGKTVKFCQKCNKISEAVVPTKCEKCLSKLLYQCKKCSKLFKTCSLLSYHWYTRCGVKGYFNCTECDFKSVWRSKVAQHMKLMHKRPDLGHELENIGWISLTDENARSEANTHRCPKCSKTMKSLKLLKLHIQACGGVERKKNIENESQNNKDHRFESEPNKCSVCGEKFDHIYTLNVHVRLCRQKYMTKVPKDVEVVETNEDDPLQSLISADKRHARYTKFITRYCHKCQEDIALEEKNWGIGSQVPCRKCKTILLFKCKICLKEYARFHNLKIHLDTTCNPIDEFKCSKCNYKARDKRLVKGHYDSVHANDNVECNKCGRKFKSKEYLRKHLLRCGTAAKFKCEHCPFKSKLKVYLRKHIFRTHMEPVVVDRKDMIIISRQRFTHAARHLTAHCSKCKKEQRLTDRLKTCGKCKTKLYYKCKTCKQKYDVDDENACDHVKAYLETIKFECKRCGRGAISEKSLWMHEHSCGAKATFKCRFCKVACRLKGNLTKHEKVVHPHEF